jgi:hypothetical protein
MVSVFISMWSEQQPQRQHREPKDSGKESNDY